MTTTTPLPKALNEVDFERRIANAVNQWMALEDSPAGLLDLADTAMITETPSGVPWPTVQPTVKPAAKPEPAEAVPSVLAEIVAALPGTLVVLDPRGCVKLWTDSATLTFGWSSAEVVGTPPPFLSPAQAVEHRSMLSILNSGHLPIEREVTRLCKDGTSKTLILAATRTVRGDTVLSFRDPLASRATVADVEPAPLNKLEALGGMVAMVSHDFNNILGAITGCADMLAERATLTQADRNLVAVIRKAGEHATGLTQRLIQFSKPAKADAPTIKAVNVPAVLDGLEPLIKALVPATVRVTVQAAHGLPAALTDETVLEQIILNLAINAGQAMPRGGTLHLRGEAVVLSLPKLNLVPGRYVAITVADTGPGMDDGVKSKLFEPYFTTRRTGIGLGLATVKRLVHDAGGAIELDSEPGRGSSFRVLLPAQFIPLPLVQGAGRTVIVADDDAAHRELMKNVLESVGFDVSTAANGDEARQLARWLRDDLDLLVTDVVMPGTNGKKLAEQLRAEWPHLPVVMVSGYPQWEDAPPAATVFLEKPLAAKHLLAAVQSVLNVSA